MPGLALKGIDTMNESEAPAKPTDDVFRPGSSRLPGKMYFPTVDPTEKLVQVGNVFFAGQEARRALENHSCRSQILGKPEGLIPGFQDLLRHPKASISPEIFRWDFFSQAAVGGAGGLVGDQLPGLHGEFKTRRGCFPPFCCGLELGELVESLLNFNE